MAETASIRISNLLFDEKNPRLHDHQMGKGQRETWRSLAENQKTKKLVELAKDIVEFGLNPADHMIVMPLESDPSRYVVLEGNRRLCAVKSLESPETLAGAITPSLLKQLQNLSETYIENPVKEVNCTIVQNREEADHWIELRHTGERNGAGIVDWDPQESARFTARKGTLPLEIQVLDFLEKEGRLSPQDRSKVPLTNLRRLVSTPEVRETFGLDVQDKVLHVTSQRRDVAKVLAAAVDDLMTKNVKVDAIKTKPQRVAYAKDVAKREKFKDKQLSPTPVSTGSTGTPQKTASRKASRPKEPRDYLIPKTCRLQISAARILHIESELRHLQLSKTPNAIAVLLRVFIELSVDDFLDRNPTVKPVAKNNQRPSLSAKILAVVDDLKKNSNFKASQAKPVLRACQNNANVSLSIPLMHDYIHNHWSFPQGGDLRAFWDSFQPFIEAIWS